MADPWERLPGETARAYEAFRLYRDAGPLRKVEPAGVATGVHERTTLRWSRRFDWRARAEAWDAEVHRVEDRSRLQSIRDMHQLHEGVAKAAIQRGLAALSALPVDHIPAGAAARLIEMGVRLQRQTLTTTAEELLGETQSDKSEDDPWDRLVSELTSSTVPVTPHPAA